MYDITMGDYYEEFIAENTYTNALNALNVLLNQTVSNLDELAVLVIARNAAHARFRRALIAWDRLRNERAEREHQQRLDQIRADTHEWQMDACWSDLEYRTDMPTITVNKVR